MASSTVPTSNCWPSVFLTPISMLSKSMNTAMFKRSWWEAKSDPLVRRAEALAEADVRCYVLRAAVERRRGLRRRPHDMRELAALQELPPLAATAGDFVLRGADCLFSAAAGLDREDVAIPGRRDEAEHSVLFAELDKQHAFAGTGQVVHFLGLRQDAAALGCSRDEDLTASVTRRAHNLRLFRRPGEAAAGPGARLDQALEAEPQREAV